MTYAVSEALIERVDGGPRRSPMRATEPSSFSEIERSVIHLSQRDSLASIADLRDWRVGIARLFVGGRTNSLADKRLEELRRFAILVRVHDDPGDDAIDRFLDADYTVEQARLIHAMVNDGKPVRRHNRLEFAFLIVPLLLALWASVSRNDIGKIAISLAVGGFISTVVSFLSLRR